MGFSRQEYWSRLPFPSPWDLPDPGIEPTSPALQADSLLLKVSLSLQAGYSLHPPREALSALSDNINRDQCEPQWNQTKQTKGACSVAQLCLTLCDPMHCSSPVSSVHGIFQTRILEWIAMPSSRGSSWPRNQTCISCITGRFFTTEPPGQIHYKVSEY